jgi:hypothetical protein
VDSCDYFIPCLLNLRTVLDGRDDFEAAQTLCHSFRNRAWRHMSFMRYPRSSRVLKYGTERYFRDGSRLPTLAFTSGVTQGGCGQLHV